MVEDRFAGVDWASEEHAVCVVDERGRIVEGRRYRHDEEASRALCVRLVRLGVKLVALERPDGLLIERLLDAGLTVIAVHPNQVVAMRPRYTASGGKSDGFDSFVLAELARTDSHRFRTLTPDSDRTKALRALTRELKDLVRTRVGLANQLRDQLATFWPGAGKVFCAVDSPIALAFLRATPAPSMPTVSGSSGWRCSSPARVTTVANPPASCSPGCGTPRRHALGELETQARRQIVLALVTALEPVVRKISELTIEIRSARSTRTRTVRRSGRCSSLRTRSCAPPRCSRRSATAVSATTYRALAADAGQCPVAVESGKSRHAKFRWACDHRLREAFNVLADRSRHHNPWAADIYQRARARGAGHAHAARILGRAWTQVIWRLWHDQDTYYLTRHTARQRLTSTHT